MWNLNTQKRYWGQQIWKRALFQAVFIYALEHCSVNDNRKKSRIQKEIWFSYIQSTKLVLSWLFVCLGDLLSFSVPARQRKLLDCHFPGENQFPGWHYTVCNKPNHIRIQQPVSRKCVIFVTINYLFRAWKNSNRNSFQASHS